jgi:hypothetical protein
MVPTTESNCNPQLEIEARIEGAASLAACALLNELEADVALAGIVVLLEHAARFLQVAEQEAMLAGVTV